MMRGRLSGLVIMAITFCLPGIPIHARYGGGTGEPNDPYLIYTAGQLNTIGATPSDWDKHFKLMADIDLAELGENGFRIIGSSDKTPFSGVFDGNGHCISNFVHPTPTAVAGFFGVVADPNAEIRDLTLVAPRVNWPGGNYVGLLVAYLQEGTLSNCHVEEGEILSNNGQYIGGLVGMAGVLYDWSTSRPILRNCSFAGQISGQALYAGGLVGMDWLGCYYGCCANCEISEEQDYSTVGGLVAYTDYGTFIDCYSLGSAKGGRTVGGLIGVGVGVRIIECYTACRISDAEYLNGLFGQQSGSTNTASFWDAEVSDRLNAAGGAGKNTTFMQDPNMLMAAGWDFVGKADGPSDVWVEPAGGGYPILWWQVVPLPALPFAGGTGSKDDPYRIEAAEQLNSIGHNPRLMTAHLRLAKDIDLTGVQFYPIGNDNYPYAGTFDGAGFTISNFTHTTTETTAVGLLGMVEGLQAQVQNLTMVAPVLDAKRAQDVGALVGQLRQGIVRNCHVVEGRIAGSSDVGGLVGQNSYDGANEESTCPQIRRCSAIATVTGQVGIGGLLGVNEGPGLVADCHATCDVVTHAYAGGLVGINMSGTITRSSSAGEVSGETYVGGLAGMNVDAIVESLSAANTYGDSQVGGLVGLNRGECEDCYAAGDAAGNESIGALVGAHGQIVQYFGYFEQPGVLSRCYATGRVSGAQNTGGLIGKFVIGSVTACFWDIEASGTSVSAGGTGKTTAQMQTASTFLDAGWDFVGETASGTADIWRIDEGLDYPRLSWEPIEEP